MNQQQHFQPQEFILKGLDERTPMQIKRRLPPYMNRTEGQSARFEIEVSGSPEPIVEWYKDGNLVRDSPDTRIKSSFGVHTLIIPEVFPEDTGIYKAIVKNPSGSMESKCELIIEGSF
jgi:titin